MRQPLGNLSSCEYEHPSDKLALENLRKVPVLPKLIELVQTPANSIGRLKYAASFVRLNERQLPSVYRLLREACEILEVDEPALYLESSGEMNAYVMCADRPIICLTSQLVDVFDEDEMMFVLGHELAHIKAGHLVYKTLAYYMQLGMLEAVLALVPGAGLVSGGMAAALNYALFSWYRAGELTCDRGGYLACQNFGASCKALMKLAGWSAKHVNEMDIGEFMAQAREYEDAGAETFGAVQKLILSFSATTHPFAVERVSELLKFHEGGAYLDVLQRKTEIAAGQNLKEPAEPPVPVGEAAKEALKSVKKLGGSLVSKFRP